MLFGYPGALFSDFLDLRVMFEKYDDGFSRSAREIPESRYQPQGRVKIIVRGALNYNLQITIGR